jgi:REP element-mobilizing transposase RayT
MWNSRLEFLENKYYHIYNRWFNNQNIFRDKSDFENFYKIIVKYLKEYDKIKMISYSFLPNHFHIVFNNLETWRNISDFMRKFQLSYSIYFKKKYTEVLSLKKWESLFEWRFISKTLETEEYLHKTLAFVNFNPIYHNIVDNITRYPYTSYNKITNKEIFEKYSDIKLDELEEI